MDTTTQTNVDTGGISGTVIIETYDEEEIDTDIDRTNRKETLQQLRTEEPEDIVVTPNKTTRQMHTLFAETIAPQENELHEVEFLAIGDSEDDESIESESLGNELHREEVSDHFIEENELTISTFIPSDALDAGSTIREVGLFSGDVDDTDPEPILFNHTTISGIDIEEGTTLTIDVVLTFSDQSEE